jgi:tetratricopeptide (TPR) repeat protein
VTNHPQARATDPHATVSLLTRAGDYLWGRAEYDQAKLLHESAIATAEIRLGRDHPVTAKAIDSLTYVLRAQGDLDAARRLHERALIRKARLGPDHRDTAWSLTNLATVLHAQGDLDGARVLHERALAIYEARLGNDHLTTARSRRNLAVVAVLERREATPPRI